MVDIADLVNDLIPLIPKDGSRISNDQIRAALERAALEPLQAPSARKDDASPSRSHFPPGGLMEQSNASLQRGRQS